LFAGTAETDSQSRTRNRCNSQGYESVALIPLRFGGDRFGLVQLNDRRKGQFSPDAIAVWERLVDQLAIALAKFRMENALRESEERFRKVVEGTPVGVCIESNGLFRYLNPEAVAMLGAGSTDKLIGQAVLDRVHPDSRAAVAEHIRTLRESRKSIPLMEQRHLRLDGTAFDAEVTAIPFLFEGRDGATVFVRDITERKRAEQALLASEQLYRQLFDRNLAGVFRSRVDGKLLECNEALCHMLGYGSSEALHELDLRGLYYDTRDRDAALELLLRDGQLINYEIRLRRKDGGCITVLGDVNVVSDEPGSPPTILGTVLDITEIRKLEAQLLQSQKMEAIGRLAGGVAHDFNNLLMVMQSYAELMQDRLPPHDPLQKNVQEIMKAATRAAGLTRQMLAFSRKQILSPVVLDLNTVTNETVKMLRRLIGEDIELLVSSADVLWAVEADSDQIVQVLMNLCVNARDAMPDGGTLMIATGNITVEEGSVGRQSYISPGDYVWLSVTDTGTGISKEMQRSIFDPFFTTKEAGKGTGLGLSTVYGIVKQSGGHVWVDSELGRGACFTVYLPRVKKVIAPVMSAKVEKEPRGTETILVAEDEGALREALCGYLRNLGYTVLGADSGTEALTVASQHEEPIDLLITDLVMRGMSGRDLSQMMGSRRPSLKTIFMSGYADDVVLRQGIHELGAVFLQKPFSLGKIARKVRDTLEEAETVQ
jgi:PAS domain S-box-containing protein